MIKPSDAWVFPALTSHQPLNGKMENVSACLRPMADHMNAIAGKNARKAAWDAMLAARPDRDELIKAMADVDPLGPAPQVQPIRFATVADVRRLVATTPWTWELWIAANRIFGVGGFEG